MKSQRATVSVRCTTEDATAAVASALANHLRGGDVVLLRGPLGSGKTAFTRALAAGLGADAAAVSSPTFVICQEYEIADHDRHAHGIATIAHIDAYRIHDEEETATFGLDDLLEDTTVLTIVEWPDRITHALRDTTTIDIDFEHISEHARTLTVSADTQRFGDFFMRYASRESNQA